MVKNFKKIIVILLVVSVVITAYWTYQDWNEKQQIKKQTSKYVEVAEKTSKCRDACIYHPEGYSSYRYNEEKDVCYCRHSTLDEWKIVPIE